MSYVVLARKWRPQRFDEVVGQTHVVRTLIGAIESDRVAHAFVFSGTRGVGKTSLARILAKSLNCALGPTINPCGKCDSCRAIAAGAAVDVIEIDGASNNSVEDIRELRETVPYRPVLGKYKIYVIDEVHMLSVSAFNALLKTLEEPPPHVKFIFATTEAHKIPVTILSRCQRYDFRRIPTSAIVDRVRKIVESEGIEAEEKGLALIGREAEGSMRDALSLLDQILAAGYDKITAESVSELLGVVDGQVFYEISGAVLKGDSRRILDIVRNVDNQGYDITTFAKGLLEHFRNLVVAGVCRGDHSAVDLPDEEKKELFEQAGSVSTDTLHRLFKHFSEAYEAIARSSHSRILLETSLARIADLGDLVPAVELVRRIEALGGRSSLIGPSEPTVSEVDAKGKKNQPRTGKPAPLPDTLERLPSEVDWDREVEALKRKKPNLASILEYGAAEAADGGSGLTIRFAEAHRAIADLAEERKADIASEIGKRIGRDVAIEIRIDKQAPAPAVTRKRIERQDLLRRREEEARRHPLVRQAQAELGGKVTAVRLKTEPEKK
jgi:DNA polymerase-3 subunit gamma/tau